MSFAKAAFSLALVASISITGCAVSAEPAAQAAPEGVASSAEALCFDDGAVTAHAYIPAANISYTAVGTPVSADGYGGTGCGMFVAEIDSTFHRSFAASVTWADAPRDRNNCATSHLYADAWGWRAPYYNSFTHSLVPGVWELIQDQVRVDGVYYAAFNRCVLDVILPAQTNTAYSMVRIGASATDATGYKKVGVKITGE